jgi:hypothetical protein
MRVRTMLVVGTLTLLTMALGAPSALAADDDPGGGSAPPTSSAAPAPEESGPPSRPGNRRGGTGEGQPPDQTHGPSTSSPAPPPPSPAPSRTAAPPAADFHPSLSVSPRTVRPGDTITVGGGCGPATAAGLDAPDVSFHGSTGQVSGQAREGTHTVTLTCTLRGVTKRASDSFTVVRDHGRGDRGNVERGRGDWDRPDWDRRRAYLDLDPNAGDRGEEVDVQAYCPGGGGGRLDSRVLDDVRLHRDGDRLRGRTHVGHEAERGWSRAFLRCDNGAGASDGFYVHSDRDIAELLDLDPGYGHRGDEVHLYVQCARSVGPLDSDVLDDVRLDRDGRYYDGLTHVRGDAEPGEHRVRIRCGADTLEKTFFVQSPGQQGPGGGGQVSVYPKGAPETGGGPAPAPPGSSPGALALGLTGLAGAGAAGAGVVAARRRESRR